MAFDLLLGRLRRNWSRSPANGNIAGDPSPSRKVVLGGMALTVAVGLATITSPWWLPMPKPTPPRPASRPGDLRYRTVMRSPSGRIIMQPYRTNQG